MILQFHQDNLELAQYEAECLLGDLLYLNDEKTYAQVLQPNPRKRELALRLAYTRRIFHIITAENQTEFLRNAPTYKLFFYPQPPQMPKHYYDMAYAAIKQHSPNTQIQMKTPVKKYAYLFFSPNSQNIAQNQNIEFTEYFTEMIEVDDTYLKRKAHLREKWHPSAMSGKLAKCMINIAGDVHTILDPFCGTGGLIIEGLHMGLICHGSDIDRKMVYGAKINIKNETPQFASPALEYSLTVCDATTSTQQADAIVSDVPYGKNTHNITTHLYTDFLKNATNQTNQIVMCLPHFAQIDFESCGWNVKKQITQYVHKSLSRVITHLSKKD
jgi:tRNA G10  N-methylase Trm11